MNSQIPIDTRYANRPYYAPEGNASDEKITDPKQALRALRRRLALFLLVVISVFAFVISHLAKES